MATRFLNSLSSVMYVGQIFGIMPVTRRPSGRQKQRHWQHQQHPRGQPQQQQQQIGEGNGRGSVHGDVFYMMRNTPTTSLVTMTELDQADKRVLEAADANGIVNRRTFLSPDTNVRDYVKSDNFSETGGSERRAGGVSVPTSPYVIGFDWKYTNTLYSLVILSLAGLEWACTVYALLQGGINLGSIGAFNFYTIANFGLIMFFSLARKWPDLYAFWRDSVRVFDGLPYRSTAINSGVKIRTIFCCWTVVAIVETAFYRVVAVMETIEYRNECHRQEHVLQLLYESRRTHLFRVFNFHFWEIPMLEIVNLSCTFTWTYMDVFIMMLSCGLTGHFSMLYERLQRSQGKRMPYSFWIEIRTHYVILRNLVEFVDAHISILIAGSFAGNLYFICLQLFNSFTNTYKTWVHIVYFFNTLIMVCWRTLSVLKYSSEIGTAAKRPLQLLKKIPTERWNDELQRLFDLMSRDVVRLTGAGFFTLTRSLFLAFIGTVATYELVIMDLHQEAQKDEESPGTVC